MSKPQFGDLQYIGYGEREYYEQFFEEISTPVPASDSTPADPATPADEPPPESR